MPRILGKAILLAAAAVLIAGCTTPVESPREGRAAQLNKELEEWRQRSIEGRDSRIRITDMPKAGERIEVDKNEWLRAKRITLAMPKSKSTISAHAIAQMLRDKGVNIMSSLPLEGYSYTGFGVRDVDGVSALRLLFSPMGLDYVIDSDNQFVTIVPNKQKTFFIKLGPKKASYTSGSVSGNVGGSSSSSSGSSSGGTQLVSGVETGVDTGTGSVTIDQDFWGDLKEELTQMLKQCVPTYNESVVTASALAGMPPLPAEMGGAGITPYPMVQAQASSSSGGDQPLCNEQTLGNFSVNPTTGAVTVQAPHWVMEDIEEYLGKVRADNNVTLSYEGMLVMVTTSHEKSEGIDLQGFAKFASAEYGMVVNNNVLGGVTVSTPSTGNVPIATAGGDVIGSTLLGVQKLTGSPAQAFLAYLESHSNFAVKQRPRVATTNGIPAEFAQYDTEYFIQIQQSNSANSNGAVVGTNNQLIPFKVGTLLRIVPYYDNETGLVRSPITFSQSLQTGVFQATQFISGVDGEAQAVPSTIPKIRDSNYSGEVIMKDGDLIILGGQITESNESSGSGIPGYNVKWNPLSALMGKKEHSDNVSTYYLALTLKVMKE